MMRQAISPRLAIRMRLNMRANASRKNRATVALPADECQRGHAGDTSRATHNARSAAPAAAADMMAMAMANLPAADRCTDRQFAQRVGRDRGQNCVSGAPHAKRLRHKPRHGDRNRIDVGQSHGGGSEQRSGRAGRFAERAARHDDRAQEQRKPNNREEVERVAKLDCRLLTLLASSRIDRNEGKARHHYRGRDERGREQRQQDSA